MKIKHVWSVLSSGSIVSQDNNVVSIQNILEELTISVTPTTPAEIKIPEKLAIPLEYEITTLWFKDKKEEIIKGEAEYILRNPEGDVLTKKTVPIDMGETSRNHRARVKISGFPYNGEGVYMFEVYLREQKQDKFNKVASIPFAVKLKIDSTPKS